MNQNGANGGANGAPPKRYQRVLVPTDGSAVSHRAMHVAIDLAKWTKGDVLRVIYAFAVNEPLHTSPRMASHWPDESHAESAAAAERVSRNHVGVILDAAAAAGVKCTVVVGHGDVSEAILAATAEHGIDTIVMAGPGARGLSAILIGLTVLFLGSVTTRVVAASLVPVLVVK
ncbi:hypothetical protein M885DRAFT_561131 [Pelagophyceae sp. CCMP2097]|nr:hypothetical protein M885DRAFT_561131 [Pelagophyceae sp. CCMP2097]